MKIQKINISDYIHLAVGDYSYYPSTESELIAEKRINTVTDILS